MFCIYHIYEKNNEILYNFYHSSSNMKNDSYLTTFYEHKIIFKLYKNFLIQSQYVRETTCVQFFSISESSFDIYIFF